MLQELLPIAHLIGLGLGLGAATTKLSLLLRASADRSFVATYIRVSRPITHLILAGMVLLVLSGAGWLWQGHSLTTRLVTKLVLVAAIFMIGPIIDKVIEPRYRELAGAPDSATSAAFRRIERRYLVLEALATLLFYAVIVYWKLS